MEQALGRQASALLATLNIESANADELNSAAAEAFREHPDHRIITSFPGLGDATGARVLAIGDDRGRFADARRLKAFAGSAPITRASGRTTCVTHRHVKNNRLAAVGFVWAFAGIPRPGPVKDHYDRRRAQGDRHAAHCATSSTGSWASLITAFTPAKLTTHRRHSPDAPAHQNPCGLTLTLMGDLSAVHQRHHTRRHHIPDNFELCVDKKSQIQALDRTAPTLPMQIGIPEKQTHDYVRHGTTILFAALEIATGKVTGICRPRHRHQEFLVFLKHVARAYPDQELHLVMDNYATHKKAEVRDWLTANPQIHTHFTPTSASWMNLVEVWFGIIERQTIHRGTFRNVRELTAKIRDFIKGWNPRAQPFVWTKTAEQILSKADRRKTSRTPH